MDYNNLHFQLSVVKPKPKPITDSSVNQSEFEVITGNPQAQ